MEFNNPKFGKCMIRELTQADAEEISKTSAALKAENPVVYNRKMLEMAIDRGMIQEPKLGKAELASQKPGMLNWLAGKVAAAYKDAMTVPPDSSSPLQPAQNGAEKPPTS
jgi:hypothetical protein